MESLVINCETGEETRVSYTEQQVKDAETLGIIAQTELTKQTEAKQTALAKLATLGLTADDLKALGLQVEHLTEMITDKLGDNK